jgi:short-subunit dehydrogenase
MKKTALITGASSGIGRALAHEFATHGYNLILVSKTEEHLMAAASDIRNRHGVHGVDVVTIVKDLTKENACKELYDETHALNLPVDVLVNDAGVAKRGLFEEVALEDHLQSLRLNTEALTALTHYYLRDMKKRNSGMILNVGSITGFQPGPLLAVYHATKAYVVSLSEALVEELKDTNITLTCLCPGPTDTHFFERADMEDANVVTIGERLMMTSEEVAEAAYQGLMNKERIVIPGAMNKVMTFTRRLIPVELQAKVNKKFYESSEEQ